MNTEQHIDVVLKERINNYFSENKISKNLNNRMIIKIVFGFLFWGASYFFILNATTLWLCILFYSIHALSHVFLGLCIGHDASHNGTFRNHKYNKVLSIITFDFLAGVNSFRWDLAHNASHHPNINVYKIDPNLEVTNLLRLTPNQEKKKIHYYQHIYGTFLYLFLMLVWVVYNDFKFFLIKPKIGVFDRIAIPTREYAMLIISKFFYLAYTILIPIFIFDMQWWHVLVGFVVLQFLSGLLVAFILQVSHIQEDLKFPTQRVPNGTPDWVMSIMNSTIDYGINHRLFTWFFGALNLHMIHHLHPNICHVHYRDLTLILSETLKSFGIEHDGSISPMKAYQLHLKSLKYFGRNE